MKAININLCAFFIFLFSFGSEVFASSSRPQNSKTESPEWHVGYSYTWGDNCKSMHEGSVVLKEYDLRGNYKAVTFKQKSDGTSEEICESGYDRKKDSSR